MFVFQTQLDIPTYFITQTIRIKVNGEQQITEVEITKQLIGSALEMTDLTSNITKFSF